MPATASVLLALLWLVISHPDAASPQHLWDAQRDDLAEYELRRTAVSVRSLLACAFMAESGHQAVEFSQAGGICRMFSCQLGWSGCRKCRNAQNSSLPLLLVKRVDGLGSSHNCWRTFQHRVDASVDFYRNWTAYLSPFGQGEDLNYWMGLEAIHQLTLAGDRRVRWEMRLWNGSWFWWENLFFAVQGAGQCYRGTIGDQDTSRSNIIQGPSSHHAFLNGQCFSTPDNDHDTASSQCCVTFHGSWWYADCHIFNPNGRYFTLPTALNLAGPTNWAAGITFWNAANQYPFNHEYSMQAFECLVADTV